MTTRGVPWRLAFALQADGWYLRQDRCTKAHEYVFLLTKSPRYFFDSEAIKEQASGRHPGKRDVWTIATQPYRGAHFAAFPEKLAETCILAGSKSGGVVLDPFAGSGTVAAVAKRLSRKSVSCELNADYVKLIEERLR